MLKVQLSASYYHVVQADRLDGLPEMLRRCRPDLVMSAMSLPDGDALAVRRILRQDEDLAHTPMIVVTAQNDRNARMAALAAGIDDVLSQPLDDLMLQARLRSLIRARSSAEDLSLRDAASGALGLAEPAGAFLRPARISILTERAETGLAWKSALAEHCRHRIDLHRKRDVARLMGEAPPDALIIEVSRDRNHASMQLLADLRARGSTRHSAVIAVAHPPDIACAAEALDRGAHDVMQNGFAAEELALRLDAQLQRKASSDRLRDTVRDGLRAAVLDPMTGLYNRRYALPYLARTAREAEAAGTQFAVMLADLDHFKSINDAYGHPTGDRVLIETAARLKSRLRPCDMIARIGGEEFLIVMPLVDRRAALKAADRLCRQINSRPFWLPESDSALDVTISIGMVLAPSGCGSAGEAGVSALIDLADRALYDAKDGGRNKVTCVQTAA